MKTSLQPRQEKPTVAASKRAGNKRRAVAKRFEQRMFPALSLLLAITLISSLFGCIPGGGTSQRDQNNSAVLPTDPVLSLARSYGDYNAKDGTWAVYWYICGTNLESGGNRPQSGGEATSDLLEMLEVDLPSYVTAVVQTGGASNWKNEVMRADEIGRYVYAGNELRRVDSLPNASMGDPNTFASFLDFCNKEYPAEHQIVIFWDHGGGSLMGITSDEQFGNDALTLPEMRAAFNAFPAASGKYDIVGIDACLMATIDMADVLDEQARYLVASEEVEPLHGWDYTNLFQMLSNNYEVPLTAEELAKLICDGYYQHSVSLNQNADVTLSVIDLEKFPALLAAYQNLGDEALKLAYEHKQDFYSEFERAAYNSESYGIIGGSVSSFDMVDLGDLMRNTADLFEGEEAVLAALNDCVVYRVAGPLRSRASGLACYFMYTGNPESNEVFSRIGTSRGFEYLYEYPLKGSLSTAGVDYLNSLSAGAVTEEPFPTQDLHQLNDFPLRRAGEPKDYNAIGWALELGPDLVRNIADITVIKHFSLWDDENDRSRASVTLGYDTNFAGDWQTGFFQDQFAGYWYNLNGCMVTVLGSSGTINMETGAGSWMLFVPVLLNGERFVLEVHQTAQVNADVITAIRDAGHVQIAPELLQNERFEVYGAWRYVGPGEPPSRDLQALLPGDVIEPLFEVYTYDYTTPQVGDGEASLQTFESITVGANGLSFVRAPLGNGYYFSSFRMSNLASEVHLSQVGWYLVKDGKVTWAEFN